MTQSTPAGRRSGAALLSLLLLAPALWFLPPRAARAAQTQAGASNGVQQVIVVFKTHFDIGYTDLASNVVQRYCSGMIDEALAVVDQNRGLPETQQFVWTIPGWPMRKILEDWPGQTALRKQRLEQAFTSGRFVVHSLPFTLHTESLEPEDLVRGLGYSSRLARGFGLALPRDAKMTDVPEHTWALATVLHQAGVKFLAIGPNGQSSPLRVPPLYWWEGPDGSRLLTMYTATYGTQLMPPKDWPYHTWLALLHTGDNHGPPRPEEVQSVLSQLASQLPGVKARIGRLSDFAEAVLAEKPALPVIRGDAPDTWIHGPMSDPAGAQMARHIRPLLAVLESLNTHLRGWGLHLPDAAPAVTDAYEQSLLYGEHTWGGSSAWIGRKVIYGDEFCQARAAGRFGRIEASWDEHSAYIQAARDGVTSALHSNLQALAAAVQINGKRVVVYNPLPWKRAGLVILPADGPVGSCLQPSDGGGLCPVQASDGQLRFFARDLPPMGYRTYVPVEAPPGRAEPAVGCHAQGQTLESPFFRATVDPARGVVSSLCDKRTGRELLAPAAAPALGQYLYERFDADQVRAYCQTYLRKGSGEHGSFFKPGLPPATQAPYQALSPGNFQLRFEQSAVSIAAVLEAKAATNLPAVTTRLVLYRDEPYADLELTLHAKPAEPLPEAGWLCLPFNVSQPQFRLGRLGSIIDPAQDLIPGANRHCFDLNSGLTMVGPDGQGVGLCPLDSPLVSLDTPGCWKYSLDFVPSKPVAYVNLFNNQWNTNFRLWNQGTWTSRVRLWAFSQYEPASTLITPSLEARFPIQGAVAEGPPGALPPTRSGLAISGQGVLVTAFGSNPDGKGTVLRLWEYAGRSGKHQIRLPAGFEPRHVQPVNLRGEPLGEPLPVRSGTFSCTLNRFAPASFVLGQPAAPLRATGRPVHKPAAGASLEDQPGSRAAASPGNGNEALRKAATR